MSSPNWWGDWRPNLPAHSGNLQATDLIECTSIVGGLPVNTAITGQQIINAASGGGATWGSITGTLSSQTDLQSALNAKQDTLVSGTNIKTVNSTSLLGSGDVAVQPTLVSGTNIKTVNGNSLLGSGDLTISGGGGGINTPLKLPSGSVYSNIPFGASNTTFGLSPNLVILAPFIPSNTFTTSNIFVNVTTLGIAVSARILIYSHSITTGLPDIKIFESANIDCSTIGVKTVITSQSFTAGTAYWLGIYANGSVVFSGCVVGSIFQIGVDALLNQYNAISRNLSFGSAPSPFGTTHNKISANALRIGLTIA